MIIRNIHPAFGQFIMVVLCVCLIFVLHLSSSDIIVICVQIRVKSYVMKFLFKYEKESTTKWIVCFKMPLIFEVFAKHSVCCMLKPHLRRKMLALLLFGAAIWWTLFRFKSSSKGNVQKYRNN